MKDSSDFKGASFKKILKHLADYNNNIYYSIKEILNKYPDLAKSKYFYLCNYMNQNEKNILKVE